MAFSFTDRKLIATVFIQNGYVLDFTDVTFAEFFRSQFGIDIDRPMYRANGTSKGNAFGRSSSLQTSRRLRKCLPHSGNIFR
jgi:hypothetical protein